MKEFSRVLKFIFFSILAGLIELLIMKILVQYFDFSVFSEKIISTIIYVYFDFKLNKIFTFESDVKTINSLIKLYCFYIVFSLFSYILLKILFFDEIINAIILLTINFVIEYIYQKNYIFKGHIDNQLVKIKM